MLASSTADLAFLSLALPWHPNIVPAWSPDGLFIAVPGASSKAPAGRRVLFVDSRTGSTREVTTPNGPGSGLGWLDPHALVLNVAAALYGAQSQLFRVTYPAGFTTRLTNDPNDYAGISLTSAQQPREPVSSGDVAWSGGRLLYGGLVGGRPAILQVTPGEGTSEEVLVDAALPAATSDGRTIVFVLASSNGQSLSTADASGRRIAQLVPNGAPAFGPVVKVRLLAGARDSHEHQSNRARPASAHARRGGGSRGVPAYAVGRVRAAMKGGVRFLTAHQEAHASP